MIRTSVVILNWNGKKLLEKFLPSVIQHSISSECNVIVADNASSDDSVRFLQSQFPHVPLIILDKNYGFAEGYNKALQQINSEYVVLLNSDVETTAGWLTPLIHYMDTHPEVAAVQPKIKAYNQKEYFEYAGAAGGFIDRFGYPFCRGRILEVVEKDTGQYDTPIPIFWATGACLLIRKSDYTKHGGLDGSFFAHMEEIDLCWRLHARGRKVMCIPLSTVYHVGGASLGKDNPRKMYLNFRNNLFMLYKNIPAKRLFTTFFVRCIFDSLALIHLLLKGNLKSARAVIQAYNDFLVSRKRYAPARKANLQKTVNPKIAVQYSGSILLQFYSGNKTYHSLSRFIQNENLT